MHFKNGKLNYDSSTITDKFREFEIDYRDSENVVGFAIACIDMNSVDDLLECTKHTKQADMEQWKITATEWRAAIDAALNAKLYSLVADFMRHVNCGGDLSEKLISELLGLELEFTRYDSDFEDLPRQITDAIPKPDFSAAADFYRQHFRIEPADVCFEDNENGIFRIDDAAISEVIAEFTFEDDE
jgi:hypothetical protein